MHGDKTMFTLRHLDRNAQENVGPARAVLAVPGSGQDSKRSADGGTRVLGTRRKALATVANGAVTAAKRHKPDTPTAAPGARAAASLDVALAVPDSHRYSLGGGPFGAAAESTVQVRRACT